jgi:hypothetical protein
VLSSRSIDQFLQLILSCSVQIADENPICCEYCCQSFSRMSESLLGVEMCFELVLSSRSNDQILLLVNFVVLQLCFYNFFGSIRYVVNIVFRHF